MKEMTSSQQIQINTVDESVIITKDVNHPVIIHGDPITNRKSTFQSHIAEVHSLNEITTAIKELKDNRKVALATHNIIAYRFIDSTKNCLIEDYDDDGETSAGGRLLHLLQVMNALNVLVVVTRWYTY
jgi:putative IMPACT (imprinted ancient) family translation regulator